MKKLKIYYTSDIHGYFYPTTYGDHEEKAIGLFKCVSQYRRDEDTLYIDGGDILQGSAYSYYCRQVLGSNKNIAAIMNECGCDYYTLGNHDFNYGVEYLKEYTDNVRGRCVCQNLTSTDGDVLYPYDIKVMPNGLRVGIVGIVTDYVNVWEKKENIKDVIIADPFEAAKNALMALKGKTDINICVYHGGFECDLATGERMSDTTENVGYKICQELDFDVLLTGHQHMSTDGRYVEGTYVVQPQEYAKEFHCLNIECDNDKIEITSEKIKADGVTDATLAESFKNVEDDVQEWLNRPLGYINRDLLPKDKVSMALNGSDIAVFLNRVQLHFSGAQISAVGLANEIAGFHSEVSTRDIIATYPYPNTLVVLRINGEQLRRVMERSAEYLETDEEGNVVISDSFLVPKVEHYNYDYYAGVSYSIDPARPVGERICNLSYEGKLVEDTDEYTMCINNYRSTGAGGYDAYTECEVVKEINVEMVELIMDYFREYKKVII